MRLLIKVIDSFYLNFNTTSECKQYVKDKFCVGELKLKKDANL